MRLTRRRAAPGDTGLLVERARSGDAVALAALRADLDAASLDALAAVLDVDAAPLAVLGAGRAASGERLAQVVGVLEQGGRSPALVAELLGLPVPSVLAAREGVLAGSGQAAAPPGCRGWLLVSGGERLTPAERSAADDHLAGCRRCTEARAAATQAGRRAAVPGPRPPARA